MNMIKNIKFEENVNDAYDNIYSFECVNCGGRGESHMEFLETPSSSSFIIYKIHMFCSCGLMKLYENFINNQKIFRNLKF